MKNIKNILVVFLMLPFLVLAQEEDKKKKEKLERDAFDSSLIIDNPTNVLLSKDALEVQMQHRFGLINGGTNDMAGFWGASNIRIAVSYGIHERLTIGFGTTKFSRLQDFNWKAAILRQTRSNSMPFSLTYYGNFTIDARTKDKFNLEQDRYSYFNQLIIAKRFSPNVSFQIAPSVSHYNLVHPDMKNDLFSVAIGGRVKVSPQTSILIDYSQPITKFDNDAFDPKPGVSIGFEFATSAHEFQIFLSNNNSIVPQRNYMYNQNDFFDGDFLIGFNITRIYNF
jgi:hypothetical protein